MEKDPLEQFISDNRAAFDRAEPDPQLWSQIAQALPAETPIIQMGRPRVTQYLKYAAAAIILVSVSVFGTMEYMKPAAMANVSVDVINEINELADFYDFEVKRKLNQLAAYDNIEGIDKELSDIDAILEDLKVELDEVPKGSEEKVINAMISNFQLKIMILERMLEAKENNLNNTEKRNNEVNI